MYRDDVPIIAAAARADLRVFKNCVMFALLSARVQFNRVPGQAEEVAAKGDKARALWGWKIEAYKYLEEHANLLWQEACGAPNAEHCIRCLCRIPGLGIVKAAFVAQMLGFDTACFDTRNIAREGRNPRAYRTDGEARKRAPAFVAKVQRYCLETRGRAEELWDTWCAEVGPDYGMTAAQCSRLHVDCIVPRKMRKLTMPVPCDIPIPF